MRAKVGTGIALFVAGGVAVLAWQRFIHSGDILAIAGRVTEARISAFDYQPLHGHRSSPKGIHDRYDQLFSDLQDQLQTAPTSDTLHRLALLHLATRQTTNAELLLQRAAALPDADASVWSDLAAVELASGKVVEAAEHAARALELDQTNLVAAFNWALALENLQNRPLATDAWEHYLDLDSGSEWAEEARQHLARLNAARPDWTRDGPLLNAGASVETVDRIAGKYPQRARAKALKELLPRYVVSGNAGELALLRRIAALRAAAGDFFLHDAVEQAAAHRVAVLPGFSAFAAGNKADEAIDMEAAAVAFHQAAAQLRSTGSPVAIAAAIYAARSDNYASRTEAALAQLAEVNERLTRSGDRYLSMATEEAWIRGLVYLRRGKPHECLDAYREALGYARRTGEIEHEASIMALIATQLDTIADPVEAGQFRRDALRALDAVNAESRRMYTAYLESGTGALRSGRPRVALSYLDAASRIGRAEDNAMYVADCDAWRALAFLDLGRAEDAAESIASARTYAPLIQTPGFRERTLANIAFITGRIEARSNPVRAIVAYTDAVGFWDRRNWRMHLASAFLARGEAQHAIGDVAAAESDYRAAIAEMEDQRQNLTEPELRISYFERADRAFTRLIELLIERGRDDEALSIVERKRARVLLDHVASAGTTPLDAPSIAARIGARTSLLHISLLDHGVHLWVTRDGRTTAAHVSVAPDELQSVAAAHVTAIEENDVAAARRSGRWLFDRLIAPVVREIPADSDLVVVPDGVLESFPFATLITAGGEFLIDRQPIAIAPSASVFLRPQQRTSGTILAVAQPAPPGFDVLPDAYAEASAIAGTYRHAQVLRGLECPPARFLEGASHASLVHYAGHARTDTRHASRSALIFESTSANAAELTAETIGRARFVSAPLIVLAACGTGRGPVRRNEGIASLASAFLQAGARGVVATLWDVQDEPSADLFRVFHRHLEEGRRPADALREAQRAFLHSEQPDHRRLSTWASAVIIGTI